MVPESPGGGPGIPGIPGIPAPDLMRSSGEGRLGNGDLRPIGSPGKEKAPGGRMELR